MGKDTKDKILDAALQLFNTQSVDQVTVRDVAKKVGMSHGNLCYHFPNTESLIENLYKRLALEMDEQLGEMTGKEVSFSLLRASSAQAFRTMYKYKFLMLDFVSVMRKSKYVREHYRKLYKLRKEQFKMVLSWMLSQGYLRAEMYPGHYDKVIEQLFIVGDFWIASSEILYDGKEKDKVEYYADISNQILIPYFTDKALKALME
jgi:AcrR family transcriptional regulator